MALGKTKDDILGITGEITFDDIKAAIDYLDKNKVTPRGETSYFLKDEEKIGYSFNQIIKTINNDIKKNKTLLKTGEVDTFEIEKIFQNIKFPENYKLIFPWNENGKIQIKKIRDSIIDYAKNLGFELNDNPSAYTAIRYMNRNFAEIHYPDRDSKIRVDVFYDRLPQSFRNKFGKKLKRYPDSHNYALNGKFVVTLATKTVEQIKEIIQYSYEHGKEILDKEGQNPIVTNNIETQNTSSNNIIPLNQILYGPPGTGKTYNTVVKAMEIIGSNYVNMKDKKGNFKTDYSSDEYKKLKEEFNNYKNEGRIEFVTFHQSYSYEEFVEGIKPDISSDDLKYKLNEGIFKRICVNADAKFSDNFDEIYAKFLDEINSVEGLYKLKTRKYKKEFGLEINSNNNLNIYMGNDFHKQGTITKENLQKHFLQYRTQNDWSGYYDGIIDYLKEKYHLKKQNKKVQSYILIIDEINRGNISKIFGELITLIEEDKRENMSVKLPYSQDNFTVPKNLYIIGTMNTSDRSIASIDIALRRRFIFKEMMPNVNLVPDIKVFGIDLRNIFTTLNERISVLLDRDHQIGHSYFMKINNETDLERIWFDNVLPLLNEYFYGDWEKLCALLGDFQPEGKSFIKKINNVKFANSYSCDEDEKYDFVSEANIDFEEAIKNAFKNI